MIHIGLFEGIGGFSIAAEMMGWRTLATCEINPFCQKILKYYWTKAYHHDDIKTLTYETIKTELSGRFGTGWRNEEIILTGGFPCQPYSTAGKRLGKEDDRHLWPEMLRTIREIKPAYVVGENVSGIISWNGGLVFNEVQTDLENEGYEVWPVVLPACAIGAPHRRDRTWFVAYSNKRSERPSGTSCKTKSCRSKNDDEPKGRRQQTKQHIRCGNVQRNTTYTECIGQSKSRESERLVREEKNKEWKASWAYDDGRWPTQSPVCSGDDGLPSKLDGITISELRKESVKAYGNAIVPQLAYEIFKIIEKLRHEFKQIN